MVANAAKEEVHRVQQGEKKETFSKQEVYEAWKEYKAKATKTVQPLPFGEETQDNRQQRLRSVFGDNEHFNALGARWPLFS